jgi:hypothetical protein
MLDDSVFIPKPRIALFGREVFVDRIGYNLTVFRKLAYGLSQHWNIILVGMLKDFDEMQELHRRLTDFNIPISQLAIIDATWDEKRLRELVHNSDIVYGLPRNLPFKVQSVLRPPMNATQAVEAVCYFSQAMEEFSHETYYAFLSRV